MPARRPPPLPMELFVGQGPLAPGSAKPPSPSTIHPQYIIDAHSFTAGEETSADPLFEKLAPDLPRPHVKSAVQVKLNVSASPATAVLGVKPFTIHPTILNLALATPPSVTNIAKGTVDIIVPCTQPLEDKDWDLLDEAVSALDGRGGGGGGGDEVNPMRNSLDGTQPEGLKPWENIVISGILPQPFSAPAERLTSTPLFQLHASRLAALSLHPNVYLKILPPVISLNNHADDASKWWEDKKEVMDVLRTYLSQAIEIFGTHRLVFGSDYVLPIRTLIAQNAHECDVGNLLEHGEWYAVLRQCIAELGEDADAMTAIMGGNASRLYQLDEAPRRSSSTSTPPPPPTHSA